MDLMPEKEEQVWLLRALVELTRRCGWQRFIRQPILEPTPEFFPEAAGSTDYLLDRTARRLLHYVDMGEVELSLELIQAEDPAEGTESPVWLSELEGEHLVLGARADFSPDAEDIAGVLSHVVARAFRQRHELAIPDDEEESLLVEVTSVFLGFGILAANSSLRYRSGGDLAGDWVVTSWQTTRFGLLTPQAFTYLLAIQARVRQLDKRQLASIRGCLETNQASFFDAALELLEGQVGSMRQALGIPRHETWTETRSLLELPELPAYRQPAALVPEPDEEAPEQGLGFPTFRVRQTRPYAIVGGVLGVIVGMTLQAGLESSLPAITFVVIAIFCGAIGGFYARANRFDICSDPQCRSVLAEGADRCPGCHRRIRGRLRSPDDRLEAEERILEDGEPWVDLG